MSLIFVVGTGRCGSSLVHEILARHEDVGFISNIDDLLPFLNFKGKWNNALFRSPIGNFTRKGRARFAPSEAYRLISRQVSSSYANSVRDLRAEDVTPWLAERYQLFFKERRSAQEKPIFIHKYTGWSRMSFFSRIFPQAKFVHVIRDGRAVANSWLQMEWWGGYRGPENWLWGPLEEMQEEEWESTGKSFVTLAGLGWNILMESYRKAKEQVSTEHYYQMRYEDFVASPREETEKLMEFIGLKWSTGFDKHYRAQPVYSDRRRGFESDLTKPQIAELEHTMGNWLREYGYIE